MRFGAAVFAGFILILASRLAKAEDGEGRTAGLTLLRTIDARPFGLGQAYAAANGHIDSLGINPAGLGNLENPEMSATYLNGVADDSFGSLAYAHAIGAGALFLGASYFDAGKIDITPTGGVTETKHAQQDQVGLVGFALGKKLPISFGVAAKFYQFELAETAKASGVAGDAGVVWRTPFKGLSMGAAVQNVGSDLQYEVDKESLPQTARGGLAFDFDFHRIRALKRIPYRALLVADGIKVKDQDAAFAGGLELSADMELIDTPGTATLRGGFNSGSDTFTAGVGFTIANVVIDYAINLLQDGLDNTHRVTLGWRFTSK